MNVKDNCLIFTWIWNVLRCWISCQRTTHFHSLKIILIIGMLIQIITLKYNLNCKSNSNIVKSLQNVEKVFLITLTPGLSTLPAWLPWLLPRWLAHDVHVRTYYPQDSPTTVLCYTPTGTFFCFFSSSIRLTPAYYPYQFLSFLIILHVYWVPSGFLVLFQRLSNAVFMYKSSRPRPLCLCIDMWQNFIFSLWISWSRYRCW